jgi:hypothetical protein
MRIREGGKEGEGSLREEGAKWYGKGRSEQGGQGWEGEKKKWG